MNDSNSYRNGQNKVLPNNIGLETTRHSHSLHMAPQCSEGQNIANLLFPNNQANSTNPLLNYQSTSFSGLYNSPGFNSSLTGYENNLQWVADTRLSNQHNQLTGNLMTDKSINTTTVHSMPPTTSHSCCVNRFNIPVLDSLSSPLSTDQIKSTCDVSNYQNKSSLSMGIIDPMQSWFNFQIPSQITSNQQYCKYGERSMTQNYNIPVPLSNQVNLAVLDQTDLKQSDICLQSPDPCFENLNADNNKHIPSVNNVKHNNTFTTQSKEAMVHDNSNIPKQYQPSTSQIGLMAKDWKTSFQSIPNYVSSPNMFNTLATAENQENLLPPYSMPSAKLFYSPTDNFSPFVNKSISFPSLPPTKAIQNSSERMNSVQSGTFFTQSESKVGQHNPQNNNVNNQFRPVPVSTIETRDNVPTAIFSSSGLIRTSSMNNCTYSFSDCCQIKNLQDNSITKQSDSTRPSPFTKAIRSNGQDTGTQISRSKSLDIDNQNSKRSFRISEAETSESEESNIIVEESDDVGEVESEISIEEIKKTYQGSEPCPRKTVLLRCLVCSTSSSPQSPANQFTHMNTSFPLTSASKTPVRAKLQQILPPNLQQYLKIHNSFLCRRCLNLIESVEVLEIQLKTAKKTISDNFSRTLNQALPRVDELLQIGGSERLEQIYNENLKERQSSKPVLHEKFGENYKSSAKMDQLVESEGSEEDKDVFVISDAEDVSEFKCCYCGKVLSSQKMLNLHVQHHTKEFNYYCEKCGKGFPLKSSLETHLVWHSGGPREVQVLCEVCGQVFPTRSLFKAHHSKEHSGTFEYECVVCKKGFTRKLSLEVHSCRHTSVYSFVCEYCGHCFTTNANLKSHIPLCVKDLPYKCDRCEKSFPTESLLSRHSLRHDDVYKLRCSVCDKGFNKPSDLKNHTLSHASEKQFKCESCSKAFKNLRSLNYHAKVVHKVENVLTCSICGRNFGKKTLLADHMNSHTNERPYKCAQCEKCFTHQTTYISHLKTHAQKAKVKVCQECGKHIKTRMSVHMRFHTGEKPYKCSSCPLAFAVSSSLKKHFMAKHSTNVVVSKVC